MTATQTTATITDIWARDYNAACAIVGAAIDASIAAAGATVTIHMDGASCSRGGIMDLLREECSGGYRSRYDGEDCDGQEWSVLVGG